jgi:hypothetical protein
MADITPHVAEARRAAALTLWAAIGGAPMSEGAVLMQFASDLWPEQPLLLGKDGPMVDSPSFKAWANASAALDAARTAQGQRLSIDWTQREEAERLIARALGGEVAHG